MAFAIFTLMVVSTFLLLAGGIVGVWRLKNDLGASTPVIGEPPEAGEEVADPLTGVGNRRAFDRSGATLVEATQEDGRGAALLLMDLDRFARVNESHGMAAGDRLLTVFAHLVHEYLPPTSLVCRLGGDTFAAVLPAAPLLRARAVADEIRMLFAHAVIDGPRAPLRATVSIGIALVRAEDRGVAALLQRADVCLDRAKAGGRNRIVDENEASEIRRARAEAIPQGEGGFRSTTA